MFEKEWNKIAKEVYKNAVNHGFWKDEVNDGERMALIHAEISELAKIEYNQSREYMHGKSFWGVNMDDTQYNDDAEYLLNMIQSFHLVLKENKNKPVRKIIEAYEQYFKFQLG